MQKSIYHLNVGDLGAPRLNLLNKIYNPASFKFLESLSLEKFNTALEVGCGTGDISIWLANHINPDGTLLSLDRSSQQLAICQDKIHKNNIKNISLKELDVSYIDTINQKFDFIYCRWLLIHLLNYKEVLNKLFNLLTSGGLIVCEDGVIDACYCSPENIAFEKWKNNLQQTFIKDGRDSSFGNKLYNLFQDIGATNIIMNEFQPILTTVEEKKALELSLIESKNHFFECGVLKNEAEYEEQLSGLIKLSHKKNQIGYFLNKQVGGYKL